ncbi:MAG: hypothetical protein QOI78_13, partial [Actinomycetota bacterium]|nr:hypothetical protein [Actinomycetota bacterium]
MTITLKPTSTVMFTGDSITDRCGYPALVAGEWCFRRQADVLDARPDVVSILVGTNDIAWHTLDPRGSPRPARSSSSSSRSSCRST